MMIINTLFHLSDPDHRHLQSPKSYGKEAQSRSLQAAPLPLPVKFSHIL